MKKILAILSILLLTFGMAFGATETATVTLNALVGETTANTGLRVAVGDLTGDFTTAVGYDNLFSSAIDDIVITPTADLSLADAEGYFTVFVKRLTVAPIDVTIGATAMQMTGGQPYYLGYTISSGNITLTTVGDINKAPVSTYYVANNYLEGGLRDARSFKYEISKDESYLIGAYRAIISFTITTV